MLVGWMDGARCCCCFGGGDEMGRGWLFLVGWMHGWMKAWVFPHPPMAQAKKGRARADQPPQPPPPPTALPPSHPPSLERARRQNPPGQGAALLHHVVEHKVGDCRLVPPRGPAACAPVLRLWRVGGGEGKGGGVVGNLVCPSHQIARRSFHISTAQGGTRTHPNQDVESRETRGPTLLRRSQSSRALRRSGRTWEINLSSSFLCVRVCSVGWIRLLRTRCMFVESTFRHPPSLVTHHHQSIHPSFPSPTHRLPTTITTTHPSPPTHRLKPPTTNPSVHPLLTHPPS